MKIFSGRSLNKLNLAGQLKRARLVQTAASGVGLTGAAELVRL